MAQQSLPEISHPVQMTNYSSVLPTYSSGGSKFKEVGKALLDTLTQPSNAVRDRKAPMDWTAALNMHVRLSDKDKNKAETMRDASSRLIKDLDAKTKMKQAEINRRLQDRISTVSYWKQRLVTEHTAICQEITNLNMSKQKTQQALASTELPVEVSTNCLKNRENREAIDLVQDLVDDELLEELNMLSDAQRLMATRIHDTDDKLKALNDAKTALERDIRDKEECLRLDSHCNKLHNGTAGMQSVAQPNLYDAHTNTVDNHETFSQANLEKAEICRVMSVLQRELNDYSINKTNDELQKQSELVGNQFRNRLKELTEAKTGLENQLEKTNQEISSVEDTLHQLRESLRNKESPLKVATTRFAVRSKRPNVELTRDNVHNGLWSEINEISSSQEALKAQIAFSEETLHRLLKNKERLQSDIAIKKKSIQIDEQQCLRLRKTLSWRGYRPAGM
jgi:inorganic pyrophosphatase